MGVKGRRWIKTRVKEAAEIKKAEIKAEATALRQVKKKQTGLEIIREYIDKALAKVDPMEAIAVVGGTLIIKNGIDWSEEILVKAEQSKIPEILGLIVSFPTGFVYPYIIKEALDNMTAEEKAKKLKEAASSTQAEITEWLISFTLSYILIHNAGAILEATGNFVGAAKSLIGVAAAA